jgi:predicted transcriptional regulator
MITKVEKNTTTVVVNKTLMDSTISVKTVKFNKNAIKNLGALKKAMEGKSAKGYCEKIVPAMSKVSNK